MNKLKELMNDYGGVAIGVYLSIFAIAMVAFSSAIAFGAQVQSGAGAATTLGAAYIATKATQPLRILATLALTPLVARVLKREKKSAPLADPPAPPK